MFCLCIAAASILTHVITSVTNVIAAVMYVIAPVMSVIANNFKTHPVVRGNFLGCTLDLVSGAKCFVHDCACADPYVQPCPLLLDCEWREQYELGNHGVSYPANKAFLLKVYAYNHSCMQQCLTVVIENDGEGNHCPFTDSERLTINLTTKAL